MHDENGTKRRLYLFRWADNTRAAIAIDSQEADQICEIPKEAGTLFHLTVDVYDMSASQRVELES